MLSHKRGVSDVLATVLLVMLSVAAVAIVAGFVIPFVKNSLQSGSECLKYNDYYKFEENFKVGADVYKYNCRDGDWYGISVSAKSDAVSEEINGFSISFEGAGSSEVIRVKDGTITDLEMLGASQAHLIALPSPGETKTYKYNTMNAYTRMKVYPVLKSGRVCDMSDQIEIKIPCGDNVNLG